MLRVIMAILAWLCCIGTDLVRADEISWQGTMNHNQRHVIIVDVRTNENLQLSQNVCPRLSQLITNYINAKFSDRYIAGESRTAGSNVLHLHVIISRYDNGNPFPGVVVPGEIRMKGDVVLLDSNMNKLTAFNVSKISGPGDSSDKLTTIEDLEPEFVHEVVKGVVQQGT